MPSSELPPLPASQSPSADLISTPRHSLHIYYNQNSPGQLAHARALHERIRRWVGWIEKASSVLTCFGFDLPFPSHRREFPELRVYKFWETPVGPHPVAMFEVNTYALSEGRSAIHSLTFGSTASHQHSSEPSWASWWLTEVVSRESRPSATSS